MVDECHATGFIGRPGGAPSNAERVGRVDIITGTLGKAMGGAMGGFTTGRAEIIEISANASALSLQQPLAPSIVGASLEVFRMLDETTELRDRLEENMTSRTDSGASDSTSRMEKVPLSRSCSAMRD